MRPVRFLVASLTLSACQPTTLDFEDMSDVNDDCEKITRTVRIFDGMDVRALPQRCFTVEGDVEVVGTNLSDLRGLAMLREARQLRIEDNPSLRTTLGLNRVKVRNLVVGGNPVLATLSGLEATVEVEELVLRDNPELASISGLRALERVARPLRIEGPIGLRDLKGFERLETVGGLIIERTRTLRSLGLTRIKAVQGDLTIAGNTDLAELAAFDQLSKVDGRMTIQDNNSLTVTNGFTARLETVMGDLVLRNNDALSDTFDLGWVYRVGGALIVTGNKALSGCRVDDLDDQIVEVAGEVDIGDNSPYHDPCY